MSDMPAAPAAPVDAARCGVDTVQIARIERLLAETPPGALRQWFSERELQDAGDGPGRAASLAARFAAKEAFAKALGAPTGLVWTDVEVRKDEDGKPFFACSGTVADRVAALGIARLHLSITHDAGIAAAVVVCEA